MPAKLLFIYFTRDLPKHGQDCPSDEQGWLPALSAQGAHVGLPAGHPLEDRIHKLFLPISGETY